MHITQKILKNSMQFLFLSLALVSAPTIVMAQLAPTPEISSTYTKLNLNECRQITQADLGLPELSEEEMGVGSARWLCTGYNNSIVYVAEGDLRMFVSYGPNAMNERAAEQTLPAFNLVGETLEWRVQKINGNWSPFATILRWHTESGDRAEIKGQILIVTKLEPGNTCHVAYIDAKNPMLADSTYNPNEIARWFADNKVTQFNCATDEPFVVPD